MRKGEGFMSCSDNRGEITIRYCGGCNPRYDRVKLAEEVKAEIEKLPLDKNIVLAVCGCQVACAYKSLKGEDRENEVVIKITSPADKDPVIQFLKE